MSRIIHRNASPLPVAIKGEGCFIIDQEGRRYFDASGGAAVSCLGHAHPEVRAAAVTQLDALEYAHTSFFTTPAAEELAELLAANSPACLGNAYFVSGGSEAVETALKMARQYHVERGEPERYRYIARRQSYHGNTLAALSVGGNAGRRALYQPVLIESHHVSPCFPLHYRAAGESDEQYTDRLAAELDAEILRLGPDTVSAFIAETVVGATAGTVAPVPGYFRKIRQVCDRHGVLLILDEVMCGLGRTGSYHAFEQEGVVPDLLTLAKGLGGGYLPIGAVLAHDRVIGAINAGSGAFQHGYTYVGHPVACAAALAVQRIVLRDKLVDRVAEMGGKFGAMLSARLGSHPHVADIRGRGMFWSVELAEDPGSLRPYAPERRLHARIKTQARKLGLLCYPGGGTIDGTHGDHVLLAPPYLSTADELGFAADALARAIDLALKDDTP
ncbi:aspartate aminotransferase family protein [Achromobacter insolitus]|uniref:aspartate aminotransferase family protein n=1 Tax=Achromobacter insolitus TaxID=217204 RepID=UPI000DD166D0|nr:aspartate aminotransferase family protein [Achromobacter insolitus]AXA73635.1 aspartate aminotransferase family protein [Achromobacter insolitus]